MAGIFLSDRVFIYFFYFLLSNPVMLFGHEAAMSSKSNFIGAFQNDCNVASIVEGNLFINCILPYCIIMIPWFLYVVDRPLPDLN